MDGLFSSSVRSISSHLDQLARLRGRLLIYAAAVYLVGYGVWSINAWANNLGLLPAIELQYFAAGFAPVTTYFLLLGLLSTINWLLDNRWQAVVSPYTRGRQRYVRDGVIGLYNWSMILFVVAGVLKAANQNPAVEGPLTTIWNTFFAVLALSMLLLPQDYLSGRHNRFLRGMKLAYDFLWLRLMPVLLAATLLVFFFERVYPNLPQELGGIRPRCAFIDLEREGLSPQTAAVLLPSVESASDSPVARTTRLDVFYSGSGSLLVKPHQAEHGWGSTTYEIDRGSIRTIEWCP